MKKLYYVLLLISFSLLLFYPKIYAIDIIPLGSTTFCQGDSVVLSVDSTNALSYQWRKDSVDISGANSSTYVAKDSGNYSVKVFFQSYSEESAPIIVTINYSPYYKARFKKIILDPPTIIDSLSVSPNGTSPFTYQWICDGNEINGETKSVFDFRLINSNETQIFSCRIANQCGSISYKICQTYSLCRCFWFFVIGSVKYENKDSTLLFGFNDNSMTYVTISIGDTFIDRSETDDYGKYIQYHIVHGYYYKLKASTDKSWGGVNPEDALLVNRSYIGLYNLPGSPSLKRQAADVNGDGKINPVDALLINRRYIGLIDKFVDKNKVPLSDWIFSEHKIKMETQDVYQNIKAICRGDVNGSYVPK